MLLGKQTVSVYKPIQDEVGVAAAIALALRSGDDVEEAATSYESPLASGGSAVEIKRRSAPFTTGSVVRCILWP